MEHVRRRKRRKKTAKSGGAAKVIVVLLLAGALIYLFAVSKVGTWLVENALVPFLETMDSFLWGKDVSPESSQSTEYNDIVLPQNTDTAETVTVEAVLPAMNCYALQMGAFSEHGNAQAEAASVQKMGAGGYVLKDGERYRVLAAGYADEASLQQVREQLKAQQLDTTGYAICAPQNTLRLTGSQEQIAAVEKGFAALNTLQTQLGELAIAYDRDGLSPEQGISHVQQLLQTVQTDYQLFAAQTGADQGLLQGVDWCFSQSLAELEKLVGVSSDTNFSSALKYAHLAVVDHYCAMANQMAAGDEKREIAEFSQE